MSRETTLREFADRVFQTLPQPAPNRAAALHMEICIGKTQCEHFRGSGEAELFRAVSRNMLRNVRKLRDGARVYLQAK